MTLPLDERVPDWRAVADDVIPKLREDLPVDSYSDATLERFARAREGDYEQIKSMVQEDVEWREENKVDTILEWLPKEPWFQPLWDYWPGRDCGADRFGLPVYWERSGKTSLAACLEQFKPEQIILLHIYFVELATRSREDADVAQGREAGDWLKYGLVMCLDGDDISKQHLDRNGLKVFRQINELDDAHYPAALRRFYVFNAPSIMTTMMKICSAWIEKATLEKICIIPRGTDPLPQLMEEIPIESIPDWVGGKLTDYNIPLGGSVPELDLPYETVSVAAKKFTYHPISLPAQQPRKKNSKKGKKSRRRKPKLRYHYRVVDMKDISFSIVSSEEDSGDEERVEEVLVGPTRNGEYWEFGALKVPEAKQLYFKFDNSFSWFTAKTVRVGYTFQ